MDDTSAPRRMSASSEYTATAVALLYALACTPYGLKFMIVPFVPILPVWLVRMAWVGWRDPARRTAQIVKACVVASAGIALVLLQGFQERSSRAEAQHVVEVIAAYRAHQGVYPDRLDVAGLDAQALRRRWRLGYFASDGRATVFYGSAFGLFDTYSYDFDAPGWVFHPD